MADQLDERPSFTAGRKWRAGFNVVVGLAALLAIVVMVNYAGRNYYFHRVTVGSQTQVKLSPQTLGLLKSITNDVRITLYYDKLAPMFSTISALATEYRLANPKIEVETVDYTRDTAGAQRIKAKYELTATTDKNLVIFDCAGRVRRVNADALVERQLEPVANPREREFRRRPIAFRGEMMFSAMLLAVKNPEPLHACYLVGHGEHAVDKGGDEFGYMKFVSMVVQNHIDLQPLSLVGTNAVPDNCSMLIIAGPKDGIPKPELEKIDAYLQSGGRLLVMFNYQTADRPTGLEALLFKWGVSVGKGTLRDEKNSYLGQMQDMVIRDFSAHPVSNPLLTSGIQMSGVHLMLPRPVWRSESVSTAADAPKVTELAFTSQSATLDIQPDAPATNYPVAVAVERGAVAGVASARGTTRIVVLGDSLFLVNGMIESLANRDLAGYAVNWLVDRTELLAGLGPKPVVEYKLVMTQSQMTSAQWILLGGLPGAVLLLGVLVWVRRRN
jgi:ABC-2 type transport system permease protein